MDVFDLRNRLVEDYAGEVLHPPRVNRIARLKVQLLALLDEGGRDCGLEARTIGHDRVGLGPNAYGVLGCSPGWHGRTVSVTSASQCAANVP